MLEPLLFIIYINDIASSSTFVNFIIYADDTTLQATIETSGVTISLLVSSYLLSKEGLLIRMEDVEVQLY